jgi:hypothetical protein
MRCPTEFVFWGQKWKITSVRLIPSVSQKVKSLTWKHPSKIRRTKFSFVHPWNHGTRQSDGFFFFVFIGFSSIKSPNSFRKSIKNFFWKYRNQYISLTSFIESKKIFFLNTLLMLSKLSIAYRRKKKSK